MQEDLNNERKNNLIQVLEGLTKVLKLNGEFNDQLLKELRKTEDQLIWTIIFALISLFINSLYILGVLHAIH